MTPKAENIYLKLFVSFLAGTLISLGVYTYTQEKEVVKNNIESVQEDVKVNDKEVNKAKEDIQNKIYDLAFTTNEKISDLQRSNERTQGMYNLLNNKVDNMIKSAEADRKLYMTKFENHEKRLNQLEKNDFIQDKNINAIAQDRGVQLFSFKY